jgi:hypothetical protein
VFDDGLTVWITGHSAMKTALLLGENAGLIRSAIHQTTRNRARRRHRRVQTESLIRKMIRLA